MPNSIPEPPERGTPATCLRWIISVIDADDPDLTVAGMLLAASLGRGGLSLDQDLRAFRIFERVLGQWSVATLDIQLAGLDVPRTLSTRRSSRACARERDSLVPGKTRVASCHPIPESRL